MTDGGSGASQRAIVERVVREVLAEMIAPGRSTPHSSGELVISQNVVSAKVLEDRIDGVTRVVVPRGAVITPAARDLLRDRRIAVATAATNSYEALDKTRVVVGVAETNHEAASVVSMLVDAGALVERLPRTGLVTVVDELSEQVAKGGWLGLVITPRTAAALCLANRRRGVRAACAGNPVDVAEATGTIAANVLVVDPCGKSRFQWNAMIRAWLRDGRRHCPEPLGSRLG